MSGPTLSATVVITSKDRKDDLRQALASCVSQTPIPEIIVVDDASSDGTLAMVRSEFPNVRLVEHSQPTGYIVGRNEAAAIATGDIIFSIDDDAIFTTPNVIQQVLGCFSKSRIGAVAIPYADVKKSPQLKQVAPNAEHVWVTDRFIGTAHAVRKELFLSMRGYRECYFHQGEERDFCLRLIDGGHFVGIANSDPIHHFESPKRDTRRMDLFGRRNDVLYAALNSPGKYLLVDTIGTTVRGLWFGIKVGRPFRMLHGIALGYVAAIRFWRYRIPVRGTSRHLFRQLQKHGPLKIEAVTTVACLK